MKTAFDIMCFSGKYLMYSPKDIRQVVNKYWLFSKSDPDMGCLILSVDVTERPRFL